MSSAAAPSVALAPVRGVRATWWYTVGAVIFFEVIIGMLWIVDQVERGTGDASIVATLALGATWCLATLQLLRDYRHRTPEHPPVASRFGWIAIGVVALVATGAVLLVGGGEMVAVIMLAQAVALLGWRPGLRWKIIAMVTAAIVAVMLVAGPFSAAGADLQEGARFVAVYGSLLPAMTVLSLWWWDVLITLDRARASEARLAATQERLRLATDVHDLQGHHLQVIALQLELAARLMPRDSEAGMAQLALARASVDDARQGTRDLATRFRSVPLRDELANAQDLLRAAGQDATAVCTPDIDDAPADVLGPVIRETTTNILRHGTPGVVRLSLSREGSGWVYEADNATDAAGSGLGSGLNGIADRLAASGGTLRVQRGEGRFTVTVRVPGAEGAA